MAEIPPAQGIIIGGGASVSIGIVRTDDAESKFINDKVPSGVVVDYRVRSIYESDKHRYMLPVTSPDGFQGDSVAFVQLASPTLLWVVDWTASRAATPPDVPAADIVARAALRGAVLGGAGLAGEGLQATREWVLLDQHLEPNMITVMTEGNIPLYRISGIYVYGHRRPNADVAKNIKYPRPPWLKDEFDRTMPTGKFKHGLID